MNKPLVTPDTARTIRRLRELADRIERDGERTSVVAVSLSWVETNDIPGSVAYGDCDATTIVSLEPRVSGSHGFALLKALQEATHATLSHFEYGGASHGDPD